MRGNAGEQVPVDWEVGGEAQRCGVGVPALESIVWVRVLVATNRTECLTSLPYER